MGSSKETQNSFCLINRLNTTSERIIKLIPLGHQFRFHNIARCSQKGCCTSCHCPIQCMVYKSIISKVYLHIFIYWKLNCTEWYFSHYYSRESCIKTSKSLAVID
ncbi:unnamed protein product [Paramecium octaurelia]|uniref:Uncharacterized protein n=1 Tax=Paramecium octaurelia TaxID=43137 RepID=A0A8S1S7F2_PAROT|nr:unnamed protein product [Paramecium octaurelia]